MFLKMIVDYDLVSDRPNPSIMYAVPQGKRSITEILSNSDSIVLWDHLGDNLTGTLTAIQQIAASRQNYIHVHCPVINWINPQLYASCSNLIFHDNYLQQIYNLVTPMFGFNIHSPVNFKNFLVSFNGSDHVSRKLVVSALQQQGWFNPEYSTKNFVMSPASIDGHIDDIVKDKSRFYRKFFAITDDQFNDSVCSMQYRKIGRQLNCEILTDRMAESFVHVVSETMATSQSPIISEKIFYSIVNRGLFVPYAGLLAVEYFSSVLGFKRYDTLFDYRFDSISNPIERLVELLSMLSKFSKLTKLDWHDLYLMEIENIEYNYDHFFSENFVKHYYSVCDNIINNKDNPSIT